MLSRYRRAVAVSVASLILVGGVGGAVLLTRNGLALSGVERSDSETFGFNGSAWTDQGQALMPVSGSFIQAAGDAT
jgi:hypothetical protein